MPSDFTILNFTTVAGFLGALIFAVIYIVKAVVKSKAKRAAAMNTDESRLKFEAMERNGSAYVVDLGKLDEAKNFAIVQHQLRSKDRKWSMVVLFGTSFLVIGIIGIILDRYFITPSGPIPLTIYVFSGKDSLQTPPDLIGNGKLIINLWDNTNPFIINANGTHIGNVPLEMKGKRTSISLESDEYELVNPDTSYVLNGGSVHVKVKKIKDYIDHSRTLYITGISDKVSRQTIADHLGMSLSNDSHAANTLKFSYPKSDLTTDSYNFSSYPAGHLVGVYLNGNFLFDIKGEAIAYVSYMPKGDAKLSVEQNVSAIVQRNLNEVLKNLNPPNK